MIQSPELSTDDAVSDLLEIAEGEVLMHVISDGARQAVVGDIVGAQDEQTDDWVIVRRNEINSAETSMIKTQEIVDRDDDIYKQIDAVLDELEEETVLDKGKHHGHVAHIFWVVIGVIIIGLMIKFVLVYFGKEQTHNVRRKSCVSVL